VADVVPVVVYSLPRAWSNAFDLAMAALAGVTGATAGAARTFL